jgi:hypothetical protein
MYEANWDEFDKIPWWNEVDVIGISAYYPLCAAPTRSVSTLVNGWAGIKPAITAVQRRFRRPVVFSEIGYRSLLATCRQPWDVVEQGLPDPRAQAAAYEAALRVWWNVPWWKGVHWWSVRPRFDDGLRGHDVTPQAWNVLRRWYKRTPRPRGG